MLSCISIAKYCKATELPQPQILVQLSSPCGGYPIGQFDSYDACAHHPGTLLNSLLANKLLGPSGVSALRLAAQ